jgi:hypothetical protein
VSLDTEPPAAANPSGLHPKGFCNVQLPCPRNAHVFVGHLSIEDLDTYLVRTEQSAVEFFLANAMETAPILHRRMMDQLNLTMKYCYRAPSAALSAPANSLSRALRKTAIMLGRDVDFGEQGDRELVGLTLIRHIRESAVAL